MDAAELEECMKDLDLNSDNKISYEEFSKWWLSGRQGLSTWMRNLLSFKLKTVKFFDSISTTLNDVITDSSASSIEYSTSSLSININKVLNPGTTISAKFLGFSPELSDDYNRIKSSHKFGLPEEISPSFINIVADIKGDSNIDTVISELDAILNDESAFPPHFRAMISYINDGGKLSVALALPFSLKDKHDKFS